MNKNKNQLDKHDLKIIRNFLDDFERDIPHSKKLNRAYNPYKEKEYENHREIWEKYHGKKIPIGFEIHHINKNKKDNRIENLQLIRKSCHASFHAKITNKRRWKNHI